VQLKQSLKKEADWPGHGFVTVKSSEGIVLATHVNLQHNMNRDWIKELSKDLAAKIGSPWQQGVMMTKESAPEDS